MDIIPANGQGNHATFVARVDLREFFVRLEDGPEGDVHLAVESEVIKRVRAIGLPAPEVIAVDVSRREVPFAWQMLEKINEPDLNRLFKAGELDLPVVAGEIGRAVARWQEIATKGFGPFNPAILAATDALVGYHATYPDYFFCHLERHLKVLTDGNFIKSSTAEAIGREIRNHQEYLELAEGCLVHKDLALWNILGNSTRITSFIDWDDAISGDATDDLSLLGCFHDGRFLSQAIAAYSELRPLPTAFRKRFWLHLLRNMIVKSVIRLSAGYFERDDSFFLIEESGGGGRKLRTFTLARLETALEGLRSGSLPETL